MEDNSNDSLFGFTAITDLFTEQPGQNEFSDTTGSEEIDDEELERLKQESKNARPATPGSKINKQNGEDNGINGITENTGEEEAEETGGNAGSLDQGRRQTQTGQIGASEEEGGNEETDGGEYTGQVTALFDAISEELGWEFTEEEEDDKPKTVEELVNYFKDVITEQSIPNYASEDVAKLDEFVRNGGRLEDYFAVSPDIDYENIDLDQDANQKIVLKELLLRKGYNENQITRKIERFEDAGVLEDEARDAVEELQEITKQEQERLLADQKIRQEEYASRQQKFIDDVVSEINNLDDIRGIKIPTKDKKELLSYIFKADANGRTQYQKDYAKSVRNLIESAYFTMRGDTLLDTAKKQGTSSAIKNLKDSLRSTGVSKGTKRVNTNPSNSIFSRAVQLL